MISDLISVALAAALVIIICSIIFVVFRWSSTVSRKSIIAMNREIAKYDQKGWLILIDSKKKIVGLYHDQHSVSHDTIHIGEDLLSMKGDDPITLTVEDFRKLDVDVPRISYRVLYEYEVPHSTPVIIY